MKIYIGVDIEIDDKSYVNLGFRKNIDAFCMDYECDEIRSDNILNYIHIDDMERFIVHLVKKLGRNGKLSLCGNDYIELCKSAIRHDVSISEFNNLVFGKSKYRPIISAVSLPFIVDILQKNGMKIMTKRLNDNEFFIEAVKI